MGVGRMKLSRLLTVLQLVKLLYFVDREALLRRGAPVTGDRMVSMDHGPVLSTTLDLINEWRSFRSLSHMQPLGPRRRRSSAYT